jgi:hypothetical protein
MVTGGQTDGQHDFNRHFAQILTCLEICTHDTSFSVTQFMIQNIEGGCLW